MFLAIYLKNDDQELESEHFSLDVAGDANSFFLLSLFLFM